MIHVLIEAPFAVFRTFTAGWYRPTATFMTPSAAYGLLLNLAGIEMRVTETDARHKAKAPATLARYDVDCKLAIGVPWDDSADEADQFPRLQSMFQQLHNYPVGSSGKEHAKLTHGNKYNITPVRREFLSNLRAIVAVDENPELEQTLSSCLCDAAARKADSRYGLPFLGDNSFLPDRIDLLDPDNTRIKQVRWYRRLTSSDDKAEARATRFTWTIDRAVLAKTRSAMAAPGKPQAFTAPPPDLAWFAFGAAEREEAE